MIYYFSGTGNSCYVARRLAERLGESLAFIPETDPDLSSFSGKSLGFVFPVYAWGVPPVVDSFISRLFETADATKQDIKGLSIWIVCTCGDEVALTPEMVSKTLACCKKKLDGAWSVQMPNNYVLLPGFDVDSKEVERGKLEAAPARIDTIADKIAKNEMEFDVVRGSKAFIKSRLIHPLFRRWGIAPSKWRWTPECVGCEKCAAVCPMQNIIMLNGHPHWGDNCVSCLACYHICPTHGVAYGNATRIKGQYHFPEE